MSFTIIESPNVSLVTLHISHKTVYRWFLRYLTVENQLKAEQTLQGQRGILLSSVTVYRFMPKLLQDQTILYWDIN